MTQLNLPFPFTIPIPGGSVRIVREGWLAVFLDNGSRIAFRAAPGVVSFTPRPVKWDTARTTAQIERIEQ